MESSVQASQITGASNPKPALGPKPRLAPKPFSLQTNTTIRSIHAPTSAVSKTAAPRGVKAEDATTPKPAVPAPPLKPTISASVPTKEQGKPTIEPKAGQPGQDGSGGKPERVPQAPPVPERPKSAPSERDDKSVIKNNHETSADSATKLERKDEEKKDETSAADSQKLEESGSDVANPALRWGSTRKRLSMEITSRFELGGGPPPAPSNIAKHTASAKHDLIKAEYTNPEQNQTTSELPEKEDEEGGAKEDYVGGGSIKRRISLLFDSRPEVTVKREEPEMINGTGGVKARIKNWDVETVPKKKPQFVPRPRSKSTETSTPTEKTPETPPTEPPASPIIDQPTEVGTSGKHTEDGQTLIFSKSAEHSAETDPATNAVKRDNSQRRSVHFGVVEKDDGGPPIVLGSESDSSEEEQEEQGEEDAEADALVSVPVYRRVGLFQKDESTDAEKLHHLELEKKHREKEAEEARRTLEELKQKEEKEEKERERERERVRNEERLEREQERARLEEEEREKERLRQERLEEEEREKEKLRQEEKERQRRELERRRLEEEEKERLRQEEMERQRKELERRRLEEEERERLRQEEMERQRKELERRRLEEEEKERLRQEAMERQRKELERRRLEEEEKERLRQEEMERQRKELERRRLEEEEKERLRQEEMERQRKELERRRLEEEREIEKLRQEEMERQRKELERRRLEEEEKERLRQEEIERQRKELERRRLEEEREIEKLRQEEMERQRKGLDRIRMEEEEREKERLEEKEMERHKEEWKSIRLEEEHIEKENIKEEELERERQINLLWHKQKQEIEMMNQKEEDIKERESERQWTERERLRAEEEDKAIHESEEHKFESKLRQEDLNKEKQREEEWENHWVSKVERMKEENEEEDNQSLMGQPRKKLERDKYMRLTEEQGMERRQEENRQQREKERAQEDILISFDSGDVPSKSPHSMQEPPEANVDVVYEDFSIKKNLLEFDDFSVKPTKCVTRARDEISPFVWGGVQDEGQAEAADARSDEEEEEEVDVSAFKWEYKVQEWVKDTDTREPAAVPEKEEEEDQLVSFSTEISPSITKEEPEKEEDADGVEDDISKETKDSSCTNVEEKGTDILSDSIPDEQNEASDQGSETNSLNPESDHHLEISSEDFDTTDRHSEADLAPFPESSTPLLDSSAQKSKAHLSKRRSRTRPSRSLRTGLSQRESPDWRISDSSEVSFKQRDSDSEDEQPKQKIFSPHPTSQRVPIFPGLSPAALIAQIKRKTGGRVEEAEEDNGREEKDAGAAPSPSQLSSSPRAAAYLAGAARVLPPLPGADEGATACPPWLKELKTKKRLSQYDGEP